MSIELALKKGVREKAQWKLWEKNADLVAD